MGQTTLRIRRGVVLSLAVLGMTLVGLGCNPATTAWFLAGGADRKQDPDHPLAAKEGKKEINVAVFVSKSPTLAMDFASVDRELSSLIAKRLTDDTKDERRPIKMVEQSKLDKIKTQVKDWRTANVAELGKQAGADYVLDVSISQMSIFQAQSAGEIYEGRAAVQVLVYDTSKPDSIAYEYSLTPTAPQKFNTDMPQAHYRKMLVERTACEIAWRHVKHTSEREIARIR
jgi:hypothetical protein